MRYIGGKNRICKALSPIILSTHPRFVVEPFCGALNVAVQLVKDDPEVIVYASDLHEDLINMWQAVKDGWSPPSTVTRDQYERLRDGPSSPERTFVGYGCSFSGKWFGGYAADASGRNYALNAKNSIEKVRPFLSRINLNCYGYQDAPIGEADTVVYCDPPYAETTRPGDRGAFDHTAFWNWVDGLTVPCYVSEYTAPERFKCIWEKPVKLDMHTKSATKATRMEKVFTQNATH